MGGGGGGGVSLRLTDLLPAGSAKVEGFSDGNGELVDSIARAYRDAQSSVNISGHIVGGGVVGWKRGAAWARNLNSHIHRAVHCEIW